MMLEERRYNKESFARGIRGAVRGLWSGAYDLFEFTEVMGHVIDHGLRLAFQRGMKSVGILPEAITNEEYAVIENIAFATYRHMPTFGRDIIRGSKANKGKLTPLLKRSRMWVNLWDAIESRARTMATNNPKLMWTLGDAEHCSSCLKLAGKVKRASYWRDKGVLPGVPGAPYLECRGYRCACTLSPTDAPVSKGPLPKLP